MDHDDKQRSIAGAITVIGVLLLIASVLLISARDDQIVHPPKPANHGGRP